MKLKKLSAFILAGVMALSGVSQCFADSNTAVGSGSGSSGNLGRSPTSGISFKGKGSYNFYSNSDDIVGGSIVYDDSEGFIVSCSSTVVSVKIPMAIRTTTIEGIADNAFSNSENLISATIPLTIKKIGKNAFKDCTELLEIAVPNSVDVMGDGVFSGCEKLVSAELSENLSVLGTDVFSGCTDLVKVNIPAGMRSIGNNAFRGCESLQSIDLPDGITFIADNTFYNCKSLSSVTLSKNITFIGEGAFYKCENLSEITLPDGLTSIGKDAFSLCTGFTDIEIPDSVTYIGTGAFTGCTNLRIHCSKDSYANNPSLYPRGTKFIYTDAALPENEVPTDTVVEELPVEEAPAAETPQSFNNEVKVTIGVKSVVVGETTYETDAAPYIQASSNSTLVPLRAVSVAIAGDIESADETNNSNTVKWDAQTKTATINANNKVVTFTAGSPDMTVNGEIVSLGSNVSAEITDGRMYIPFRALGSALGIPVDWDAQTKTAVYKVG